MSLSASGAGGGGDTRTPTGLYFPDWSAQSGTCELDEGNAPAYMTVGSGWLEDTLEDCCDTHFSWAVSTCIAIGGGTGDDTTSPADGLWYPVSILVPFQCIIVVTISTYGC